PCVRRGEGSEWGKPSQVPQVLGCRPEMKKRLRTRYSRVTISADLRRRTERDVVPGADRPVDDARVRRHADELTVDLETNERHALERRERLYHLRDAKQHALARPGA